ncbi:cardiolipin synthase [Paenibacillus selenitireducens]|uniref:Cardiolipin synthase n=1 Tax=Paenibacillus selenitireducens TaxID=1324314 RepID=A0A1T2XE26_9BACL|nr:cardiolipin synthase [Paenibacillus selenitireducens]
MSNSFTVLSVINLILAIAVIFIERRNVGTTWAWLMVFLFLPGVGFIFYLLFGQNISKRKIYKIRKDQHEQIEQIVRMQQERFRGGNFVFREPEALSYQDMIYMNLTSANALYSQDNDITVYTDGDEKFDALIESIAQAEHHVHLMYYIVRDDNLGRRLVQALTEKARENVQVRFMYDDIGSAGLKTTLFEELVQAGGKVAAFFPSRIPYINFRLNYRNHRKLAIIDGKIGYIGGFNVGDEYLGLDKRFGYWRDTHLKMEGSSVFQMQAQFILDWELASTERLRDVSIYFPDNLQFNGCEGAQIVASGPNTEQEQIRNAYIKMINAAKHTLYLQTPYFVPDDSVMNALKMATLSGVDVRIMIPAVPDHKTVYMASYSYLGELLALGAKCYLYQKGFLHAKTMVADGKVATVGTANMDIRSFKLNFEVNAFIYGGKTPAQLQEIFQEDLRDASRLSFKEYQARSRMQKIGESLTRLISPIL